MILVKYLFFISAIKPVEIVNFHITVHTCETAEEIEGKLGTKFYDSELHLQHGGKNFAKRFMMLWILKKFFFFS